MPQTAAFELLSGGARLRRSVRAATVRGATTRTHPPGATGGAWPVTPLTPSAPPETCAFTNHRSPPNTPSSSLRIQRASWSREVVSPAGGSVTHGESCAGGGDPATDPGPACGNSCSTAVHTAAVGAVVGRGVLGALDARRDNKHARARRDGGGAARPAMPLTPSVAPETM